MKTIWVLVAIIVMLLLSIARAGDIQVQDGLLNSEKLKVKDLPEASGPNPDNPGAANTKGIACVQNDGSFWIDTNREGLTCGVEDVGGYV